MSISKVIVTRQQKIKCAIYVVTDDKEAAISQALNIMNETSSCMEDDPRIEVVDSDIQDLIEDVIQHKNWLNVKNIK